MPFKLFLAQNMLSLLVYPMFAGFTSIFFCFLLWMSKVLPSRHQTSFQCSVFTSEAKQCFSHSMHAVDYSYHLCGTKKKKVKWNGVVMKEDEIVRLEEENIGRERKLSSEGRENSNMKGHMRSVEKKEKQNRRKKRKMYKESRRGVNLSYLCCSSSGHLLHYIKGFALISMPLHPSHGVCLCVHSYKR